MIRGREDISFSTKRLVIKIGTSVLSPANSYFNLTNMANIVEQAAQLHHEGRDVIIKNGYSSIINNIAEGLDIVLNTKVTSINTNSKEVVEVETERESFTCDYVVCSVPLGILKAKKIKFIPKLPNKFQESIKIRTYYL